MIKLSIIQLLIHKYSFQKLTSLFGIASGISLLYISSQELWEIATKVVVLDVSFYIYIIIFLTISFIINSYDLYRLSIANTISILIITLITIFFDLLLIIIVEVVTLSILRIFPTTFNNALMVLLIGALPALVGTTVLSSITASDLRKKSEELSDEIKNVLLKVQKIENILNKEKDKWGIFSKEVDEFEKRDKEKG